MNADTITLPREKVVFLYGALAKGMHSYFVTDKPMLDEAYKILGDALAELQAVQPVAPVLAYWHPNRTVVAAEFFEPMRESYPQRAEGYIPLVAATVCRELGEEQDG